MYNWSVDEKQFKKTNPRKYQIWRMEQMINYGLGKEKLDEKLVRKFWNNFFMDSATKKYLDFLLWNKLTKS